MTELSGTDEAIPVLVENLECLLNLLLAVCVLHLARHHGEEFWEVDRTITVGVNLVHHVLQLCFSGVLSKRAHHSSELLGCNRSIPVCNLKFWVRWA